MPGAKPLKLFFDGGCRPNPGAMEAAVVVRGVVHHWPALGEGSNNDAEWRALIEATRLARTMGIEDAILIGDSKLAIMQAQGLQACRSPALAAHRATFLAIAATIPRLRLRHVGRSHNDAGLALERIRDGLGRPPPIVHP